MALTEEQRRIIDKRMDKLREEGFFPIMKRQIPDGNRYLIISFGGTGIKTLLEIKETLETYIDEVDKDNRKRDDYIRFLAIDTDDKDNIGTVTTTSQDGTQTTIEKEKLDSATKMQFFKLQGDNARATLFPRIDPAVNKWIRPALVRIVENTPELLTGKGAGGYRQLGRLSLMSTTARNAVMKKIAYHADALTNNTADHLNIMIVSGISGGTGSGTIIDLTYLIRHTITNNTRVDLSDRSTIGGFILLPPTGTPNGDNDIPKGNANGYAALKEINHFMTISERRNPPTVHTPGANRPVTLDDKYKLEYPGGFTVDSTSNLFDVCYLMDGVRNGVAVGGNAGKVAAHVLGDCILDMICAQPVASQTGADDYQAISSFMDDEHGNTQAMLRRVSSDNAPRDADYIYCSLGHSETLIPIDLMKSYVACKLFNVVLEHFKQCADVEKDYDSVKNFVTYISKSREPLSVIDKYTDEIFQNTSKGPYYTINFLRATATEIDRRLKKAIIRKKEILQLARDHVGDLNFEIFEVYTAVMMEMKNLLEKDYNVAIQGKYIDRNTFTFSPIDLSNIENSSDAVKKYLDDLVSGDTIDKLSNDLLKDMVDNRRRWTELFNRNAGQPGFDPSVAIRQFWNGWLDDIINSTLEDFLLKSTTGDPTAHYDVTATGNDAILRDQKIAEAASTIIDRMFGAAGSAYPMADFTRAQNLTAENFNPHKYIFVPHTAEHLLGAMNQHVKGSSNIHVVPSYAIDRISCYTQYTSIPAFKLAWVNRAEADYEKDVRAVRVGMHMSETAGGRQWKNFPNLLPMSTWNGNFENDRERPIADMVQDVFNRAKELGLATGEMPDGGASYLEYTVQFLPEANRPDELLYKTLDAETSDRGRNDIAKGVVDKKAEECANALFNSVDGWLGKKATDILPLLTGGGQTRLVPSRSILDSGLGAAQRSDWSEYVAGTMLRKYPETLLAMRGTVDVMEKLKARVDIVNTSAAMLKDFAKYIAMGLLKYEDDILSWAYVDADGCQQDVGPIFTREEQRLAEYYFVFEDFQKKYNSIKEALEQKYIDLTTNASDRRIAAQKAQALTDAGKAQAEVLRKRINDPADPSQGIGSIAYANKAKAQCYDVEAIRDVYRKLIAEMDRL